MCTAVCFVLKILHCRRWVTEAVTKTQRTQSGYQRCEHDSSRSFSRWPVRNKSSICLNHRVIIVKISSRTWSWSCCYICVNHSESTWKERVDLVTLRQLRKYWVAAPSQPPSFLWKPRGLWVRFNVAGTPGGAIYSIPLIWPIRANLLKLEGWPWPWQRLVSPLALLCTEIKHFQIGFVSLVV